MALIDDLIANVPEAEHWSDEEITDYLRDDYDWPIEHYFDLLQVFKKDPTFLSARIIWVHCQEFNFNVPDEIQKKFLEGVKKQIEQTTKKTPIARFMAKREEYLRQLQIIEAEITRQRDKGVKAPVEKAYETFGNYEIVKKRHDRLKKKF